MLKKDETDFQSFVEDSKRKKEKVENKEKIKTIAKTKKDVEIKDKNAR